MNAPLKTSKDFFYKRSLEYKISFMNVPWYALIGYFKKLS